jgi:peptidyl-tRNA hydrolase
MLDPILYILMRTDLASLNPGKAMAQAAHAQAAFSKKIVQKYGGAGFLGGEWCRETEQGFGTTIVLAIPSEADLLKVVDEARYVQIPGTRKFVSAEVIFDPSYPVQDGRVVHFLHMATCGYVFGPRQVLAPILADYPLHP